jgi:hypothetical protein
MRKTCLALMGSFLLFLNLFGQSDLTQYNKSKLTFEEANLVSNYYSQTGDHSAILGGEGTQKLTDISNSIDLKFIKIDRKDRKQSFNFGIGFDHHTAASAAYINKSGSSSKTGSRFYPSLNWQIENNVKRTTFGLGASFSSEYTYHSYGLNGLFSKLSRDKNREFTAKGILFLDGVKMIYPSELVPKTSTTSSASRSGSSGSDIPSKLRSTFAASFSLSQVINPNMQVALLSDLIGQGGYLGLPFHRVYYTDESVGKEKLPNTRFKFPVGMRFNYFLGDRVIFRTYYRYYIDSWGISAHTASLETVFKVTPFLSFSPFYRYYTQTAADHFAPIYQHALGSQYATSNYEYSAFNANYFGLNFRFVPLKGLFGMKHIAMIEVRYGHYKQTTDLTSNNIGLNIRFK